MANDPRQLSSVIEMQSNSDSSRAAPDEGRPRSAVPFTLQRNLDRLQRGVVVLPSAFTLGNLFFGIYAMVSAVSGEIRLAAWCIVIAAILDTLDGSIARLTRTGSRFGAELDSLVDAVSFGVAPALLSYLVFFADASWSWLLVFVYTSAVVVRLARFNLEQGEGPKRYFHGLPSPAAGVLLASFHLFSGTGFFADHLAELPWPRIIGVSLIVVSMLMVSHVHYGKLPRIGKRSASGIFWGVAVIAWIVLAVVAPRYFFFGMTLAYVVWGLARAVVLGAWYRLPGNNPLLEKREEEPAGG